MNPFLRLIRKLRASVKSVDKVPAAAPGTKVKLLNPSGKGQKPLIQVTPRVLSWSERVVPVTKHKLGKRDAENKRLERQARRRKVKRTARAVARFAQELAHKAPRRNARKLGKRSR